MVYKQHLACFHDSFLLALPPSTFIVHGARFYFLRTVLRGAVINPDHPEVETPRGSRDQTPAVFCVYPSC
jgi:hypothetical protein